MGRRGVILLLAVVLAGCVGGQSTNAPSADPSASSAGSDGSAMPSASGPQSAPAAPSPLSASPVVSMAPRPTFAPGAGITTIVDAVRVRSRPEVSDASVKHEPTLPIATELYVLAGPVAGSGLWWYRVKLPSGVTLYHGIGEGWIAAGARDGTPWIGPIADIDCRDSCPPPPTAVTGWPTVKRGDIELTGDLLETEDAGAIVLGIRVAGLLPGSTVSLAGSGRYEIDWECIRPDPAPTGEGLNPPIGESLGSTKGAVATEADHVRVDADGVAAATLVLRPTRPAKPCPSGETGPWTPQGRWGSIQVTDAVHGLKLATETSWETVY